MVFLTSLLRRTLESYLFCFDISEEGESHDSSVWKTLSRFEKFPYNQGLQNPELKDKIR